MRVPLFVLAVGALCGAASAAQPSVKDLVGEYTLASSTTQPAGNWRYTKGRLSITAATDRHVLVALACEWKGSPKEVCRDHFYVKEHDGSVYLQDVNTDSIRLIVDPARHTVTMESTGAEGTVRRDVYVPTDEPLTDPALLRRMKAEIAVAKDKETMRIFSPFKKMTYENNRVEYRQP